MNRRATGLVSSVAALALISGAAFIGSPQASGIARGSGGESAAAVTPRIDPDTSASASPNPTPWSTTSAITVSTLSSGQITYSIDPSSTASGCSVDTNGNVTATGSGPCDVDVAVAGDGTYDPSSTSTTVTFTAVPATTSASAAPSPTPWSGASVVTVSTDSTGAITYSIDPSGTATGCSISASGTTTATSSGSCAVDVTVASDLNYQASVTSATVTFSAAAATTSALASPSTTPWSSASIVAVTTDSTGAITYSIDPSSTATGCSVSASGSTTATGTGTCVVDVTVASDPNYQASSTSATVTFIAVSGGGGGGGFGGGKTTLDQTSATSGSVSTTGSGTFTAGPITVSGSTGTVTFVTTATSPSLVVSASGKISTTGVLSAGTYSVSGTDSDAQSDTGDWVYTLTVSPVFSVTFKANGGIGTMAPQVAGSPTPLSLNGFVRKGYTFVDWNTAARGTGTSYANGASFPFRAAAELYAQWKLGKVPKRAITFVPNGGKGSMPAEIENSPTAIRVNGFTRAGYAFKNWNTKSDGKGTTFKPGSTYPFKRSVVLYAQWKRAAKHPPVKQPPVKPSFVVIFKANGGKGTMAVETHKNAAPLTVDRFTRVGYTFSGWNTAANGFGIPFANHAIYPFTSSTNLYAQWKKVKVAPTTPPIPGGVIVGPFAQGLSSLSPALKSDIDALAALAQAKKSTQITLYGFGDETSTSPATLALGRARSAAVATYLEARLTALGLKGWSISIATASPSPSEISAVVATLS
jgi:uncharacterized repeat protein (TIGR02543 family)